MDEHANAVVARWAARMPDAVAEGVTEKEYCRNFKRFLLWGGWDVATADAMVNKMLRIYERRKQSENEAENLSH